MCLLLVMYCSCYFILLIEFAKNYTKFWKTLSEVDNDYYEKNLMYTVFILVYPLGDLEYD